MQPKQITFPLDHKAHDTIIEWWYFNGHLKDAKGNRYGFMNCLFRANIEKVRIPHLEHLPLKKIFKEDQHMYFAHSMLADIASGKNSKEIQNVSMVSNDSFKQDRLFINYIDPVIVQGFVDNEIVETGPDEFHVKTKDFDLSLRSKKQPLLEGGDGFISVCGRESYYYSLTSLEASGSVVVDGRRVEVKGTSWMDHQWADTPYSRDKWTWFSLQLDDGTDMMCCEYDDGRTKDCLVDILPLSNRAAHYKRLSLSPGSDAWKSPTTKAEYPMSWDISVPEYDAALHVSSLASDQEIIFMGINYWEGPIEVRGTIGGTSVKGVGFMELVGYPSDYNYLIASGKEMAKKITELLVKKK